MLTLPFRYDRLVAPPVQDGVTMKRYTIIDEDGLARPGERVDPDDVYVNRQSPKNTTTTTINLNPNQVEYRNTPMTYKTKVAGYIDRVKSTGFRLVNTF